MTDDVHDGHAQRRAVVHLGDPLPGPVVAAVHHTDRSQLWSAVPVLESGLHLHLLHGVFHQVCYHRHIRPSRNLRNPYNLVYLI